MKQLFARTKYGDFDYSEKENEFERQLGDNKKTL